MESVLYDLLVVLVLIPYDCLNINMMISAFWSYTIAHEKMSDADMELFFKGLSLQDIDAQMSKTKDLFKTSQREITLVEIPSNSFASLGQVILGRNHYVYVAKDAGKGLSLFVFEGVRKTLCFKHADATVVCRAIRFQLEPEASSLESTNFILPLSTDYHVLLTLATSDEKSVHLDLASQVAGMSAPQLSLAKGIGFFF